MSSQEEQQEKPVLKRKIPALDSKPSEQTADQDPLTLCGRVHSIETFGTVDGPGTRLVVFMQGCPMRCAYCHNPDTWKFGIGHEKSVADVLKLYNRNRPFYRKGGITATGGEPLAQPEFVGALFEAAHGDPKGRIHTCLDSSGISYDPDHPKTFEQLLNNTDLVLLDIKHSDPKGHRMLCEVGPERPLAFGNELARRDIPVIIRHVVVPGYTDSPEELAGVGHIIASWDNVIGLDVLPYHTMGAKKYEELGIPYRLSGAPAMDPKRIPEIRKQILIARALERKRLS